jgi:hypothetical protein
MKEDLSLYGNQLNYANAIWSAAYVFGQVPSNLILTRVNVPLYIAFIEIAWTVFTFAHAGIHNTTQLYVFRFLYVLRSFSAESYCLGTNLVIALACSKLVISPRSCTSLQVTTNRMNSLDEIPSSRSLLQSDPSSLGS